MIKYCRRPTSSQLLHNTGEAHVGPDPRPVGSSGFHVAAHWHAKGSAALEGSRCLSDARAMAGGETSSGSDKFMGKLSWIQPINSTGAWVATFEALLELRPKTGGNQLEIEMSSLYVIVNSFIINSFAAAFPSSECVGGFFLIRVMELH